MWEESKGNGSERYAGAKSYRTERQAESSREPFKGIGFKLLETGSWCIAQADLELLGSSDPPASAFWVAGIIGALHHSGLYWEVLNKGVCVCVCVYICRMCWHIVLQYWILHCYKRIKLIKKLCRYWNNWSWEVLFSWWHYMHYKLLSHSYSSILERWKCLWGHILKVRTVVIGCKSKYFFD